MMCSDFHHNLHFYRKKAGLLQKDMAEKLCCSRQAYSNYECGRRAPSPEMIVRMADILGVSTDRLLRKHKPGSAAVPAGRKSTPGSADAPAGRKSTPGSAGAQAGRK